MPDAALPTVPVPSTSPGHTRTPGDLEPPRQAPPSAMLAQLTPPPVRCNLSEPSPLSCQVVAASLGSDRGEAL